VCGNSAVLKAADDAPKVAWLFATLAAAAGIPDGVLNVVQGGAEAGKALVSNPRVAVISFTGSTDAGRWIAQATGARLARVSLELGGKNAFVVCDDAELGAAVHWAALSAFSNAGQRCAAGSRILVFAGVYDEFVEQLVRKAQSLRLGIQVGCDLGPVINRRSQKKLLDALDRASAQGGRILCGGQAPRDRDLAKGCYVQPTIVDGLPLEAPLARDELFGPVATVHRVDDVRHALAAANSTQYGLTSAIHTKDIDRALWFAKRVRAGVANINIGTYGSEPHMPFGGFGDSGNGTREPGVEALDVYTELKNISILTRDEYIA
jgi:aldehyde dehydrogenase (NAD+)